jgi:protein-L-isoaspartate(D-aspartate) O-methyltransferase
MALACAKPHVNYRSLQEGILDLAELRRVYARQMLALADASADKPLEDAFAAVPREDFLGRGRWRIMTPWSPYATVPDDDPSLIYQDVVVALDEERGVNNGSPSLHARWMHLAAPRRGDTVVHVGCGAGYYTAILAELVGDAGRITAVEYDPVRAADAEGNLKDRTNVDVIAGDGHDWPRGPADIVYVNFATPQPAATWIDKLAVGGRLIFPLGVPRDTPGASRGLNALALLITRLDAGYAATALGPVSFVYAEGSRGALDTRALAHSLTSGGWENIRSLVWNDSPASGSYWFAGSAWALSFDPPPVR